MKEKLFIGVIAVLVSGAMGFVGKASVDLGREVSALTASNSAEHLALAKEVAGMEKGFDTSLTELKARIATVEIRLAALELELAKLKRN